MKSLSKKIYDNLLLTDQHFHKCTDIVFQGARPALMSQIVVFNSVAGQLSLAQYFCIMEQ